MITVIIPAYNEEATVSDVVEFAWQHELVSEVIVVDDNSIDDTVSKARQAGARIITSNQRGKGSSMKDGLLEASNEIVVFLDADIAPYPRYTIRTLTEPIINKEADFVKATFSRNAGRVTELVAKPLLNLFFPELSIFSQPLSGMIAGKKEDLLHLEFPIDYGVDISILIDVYLQKKIIREVNIGYIENNSRSWRALTKMSKEVAQAIVKKALGQKTPAVSLNELCGMNLIQTQLEAACKDSLKGLRKMLIFDMDDTLLEGRFIDSFAAKFGLTCQLETLRQRYANDGMTLTKKIAGLIKGYNIEDLISVAKEMKVAGYVKEVINHFKKKGFITGIISDSYRIVTGFIKEKLGLDFALSNELEFINGKATGEVSIPSFFFRHSNSCCEHSLCKSHVMVHVADSYNIDVNNCMAVGDSLNDLCMIKNAGIGIAFCPKESLLTLRADHVIGQRCMSSLLKF